MTGFTISAYGGLRQVIWGSYVRCSRTNVCPRWLIHGIGAHGVGLWAHDHVRRENINVSTPYCTPCTPLVTLYRALQVVYTIIAGMGVGGLFFPPLILVQAAMPAKDMATSTATLALIRQLGATVGISVGQAIWSTVGRQGAMRCWHG